MLVLPHLLPKNSFSLRYNLSQNKALLPIAFVVFWISSESLDNHKSESNTPLNTHFHLAFTESIKLFVTLGLYSVRRKYFRSDWSPSLDASRYGNDEDQPLNDINISIGNSHEVLSPGNIRFSEPAQLYPSSRSHTLGGMRSILSILAISALYSLRIYMISISREYTDPLAQYLAIPVATLCSLFLLCAFFRRPYASQLWHAALLQFCGLFIARGGLISHSSSSKYLPLLASALSISFADSLVDIIYKSHHPSRFDAINLFIFAFGCLAHASLYIVNATFLGTAVAHGFGSRTNLIVLVLSCLLEAGRDISALYVIYYYDVILASVMTSLASTVVLFLLTVGFLGKPSVFIGCLLALTAGGIYISNIRRNAEEEAESECVTQPRYAVAFAVMLIVSMLFVAFTIMHQNEWISHASNSPVALESNLDTCHRRPLLSHSHGKTLENYKRFDNILLVVFFSHARYGSNLDFHREVYSDYFPNILYIGPATREDAGFNQSYDVFVDSYLSDEDLSDPTFYKMAGRMAHHMLYTALQEYDCYGGYLWVPFDTLLNIPRLEKFNQEFFWYHSPWGSPVFNPARPNSGYGLDLSLHPPPANVSPDPSVNLTETWRGWGLDWWWGDPHVGVGVCMEAFQKVSVQLRERLAAFTDGETRFIGGSADTMYIPGRHRTLFMEVLGQFLETTCFLEIAMPTTLHLVAPRNEPILFVDHWWIYQPPFNASFVRQKWAEGYEVDTFHTFHWGEHDGEDGVWRGNHEHVADVRRLLRESAERQRTQFPVRNETLVV